ncbi:hypothetical protein CF319_g4034 [Tilletia indica]|uniref:GPI inositol-deacylase n=2 Tax=Tilletia TaxID=13289 RepID=A0A8X7NEN1_9BASI|nr:hypothetical protein CF327_g2300 [Tilletia walkeri]KAE8222831.1 hypothetical protein CF319_g4034 [Tilletia indica]KAE8228462.1 hypothetical protein CF326_g6605 [Tilletia indica]KAE8253778.1 hypothetical protein A4X13_0g3661 [Tilletia indica]KAE8270885.1 hypothetical protein A4X09_0g1456 [Tilletia walkeri]
MRPSVSSVTRWPVLVFLALAATSRATQAAPTGYLSAADALAASAPNYDVLDPEDLSMISPPLLLMRSEQHSNRTRSVSPSKLPPGASIVQFAPSTLTRATAPLYVSAAWRSDNANPSQATQAFIVWHGSQRNGQESFNDIHAALTSAGQSLDAPTSQILIVSLQFYTPNDATKRRLFDSTRNLAWKFNGDADNRSKGSTFGLFDGTDAIGPDGEEDPAYRLNGAQISTYDVLDGVITYLSNPARHPNLRKITLVGHSAGGQALSRYLTLNPAVLSGVNGIHIRSVIANAPSMVYFTNDRPDNDAAQTLVPSRKTADGTVSPTGCSFNDWRYGLSGPMPRYVAARAAGGPNDGLRLFSAYIAKDVVKIVGTNDVYALAEGSGDQSCAVQTQGGPNRRDRNYAAWVYVNLLAGTGQDVSAFYGYANLSRSVRPISGIGAVFRHQLGIVSGVGHDSTKMFASPVGISALLDDVVQPGPRPPPMPEFQSPA